MAQIKSKLITKQMPWHANMTEANHLGAALIMKPEVFEGKMTQLFTANRYSSNPLTAMLAGYGAEQTLNNREWEWSLRTATTRPLTSMGNHNAAAITAAGLGRSRSVFKIVLDKNWFKMGDVIHPGTSSKKYQIRLQSDPQPLGANKFEYKARLMSDDPNFVLPERFLEAGQNWAKLFAQYGEGSQTGGSTQFSLPITMRNKMSRFRKEYKITGDAANQVLAVKIPDSKGSMHDFWIKYAEVEYWEQWYRELERGYWYSRSTDTVKDITGRPINSGPGLQEQLEDGHTEYYSHLTTTLIEEYLMDIFYSRVAPGSGRHIKAFTGEYGMVIFHRAIMELMEKRGFMQVVDKMFMDKTSSPMHDRSISYGYQFVKYQMANGATLELIHNPLYDDREINFEIDPVTGYPVESMRFTFLDFSNGGGHNVKRMKYNKGYKLGYVAGLTDPYGPVTSNKLMSHSGDYYEMHVVDECGVHIEDVSRCGELILRRQ